MVGFAQGAEKCVTGDLACLMAAAITHHIASFTHSTVALRHRPICSWYRRVSSYEISSTWLVPRSAAAVVLDFSPGSPFALEARTLSNTGFIIFWPPMCSMRASTSLQLFHLPATSLGHRFFAYFNPDTSPCSSHHDWKIPLAMSRKVFELVARDEKYFHCTPWFFKRVSAVFKACSDTRWPACSRQSPRKTRTSGNLWPRPATFSLPVIHSIPGRWWVWKDASSNHSKDGSWQMAGWQWEHSSRNEVPVFSTYASHGAKWLIISKCFVTTLPSLVNPYSHDRNQIHATYETSYKPLKTMPGKITNVRMTRRNHPAALMLVPIR